MGALKFTSSMSATIFGFKFCMSPRWCNPALLIRISMDPNFSKIELKASWCFVKSETSIAIEKIRSSPNSCFNWSRPSWWRAIIAMFAFFWWKWRAVAAPIPADPPVITTVLFSKLRLMFFTTCIWVVPRGGIEPPTRGFSVLCSTNWAIWA